MNPYEIGLVAIHGLHTDGPDGPETSVERYFVTTPYKAY